MGNCWEEVCNEHSEHHCAEYSCVVWKYRAQDDYWMQHECPEEPWDFGDYHDHFRKHYNGTFKEMAKHVCPHGQCFHNFTDEYLPVFDDNDELIDEFLADDDAVDNAHDAVQRAEEAFDVDLDIIHGLLE